MSDDNEKLALELAAEIDAEQGDELEISSVECTKLAAANGWYYRQDGRVMVSCPAGHPGARLDLNRAAEAIHQARGKAGAA